MYIGGIDPGTKGGWAVLDCTLEPRIHAVGRMPVLKLGSKTIVDAQTLHNRISAANAFIVIEQVHAMPGQGVSSTFTFGAAYGAAHAVAQLAARRVERVTPQTWKKHFQIGADKRAALDRAATTLPTDLMDWGVLANDGAAEAALMALWAWETKLRGAA